MEYHWEGLTPTPIPPTSVFDVVGKSNTIEGFTFGVALVFDKERILTFFRGGRKKD